MVTKKRIFENKKFLIVFLIIENTYKVSPKNSFNDVFFNELDEAMFYVNNN